MATTHGEMQRNACSSYSVSNALMLFTYAKGESAQEKQKGAEQITSIATYLPYVGGSSVAPTPNCNICICISIKDRDPSDLDLKINIASAFGVPSLCKAPDDFSQCPCEFLSVPLLVGSFHFYR